MDVVNLFQPGSLVLFLLVAIRTTAAMAVGPLAAWPGVPLPARAFLGLGIALVLAPVAPTAVPAAQLQLEPTVMLQELALGLLFGVASTLFVSAVQLGAALIDFQAGFTFASALDPTSGRQDGPIERFLGAFAAVLFLDLNGHYLFLFAFDDLFRIVPVGGTPHLASPEHVATFFTGVVVASLTMALPIVTLLLVIDVSLAVLNRAAPQFNIFAIGLPAKGGLALVALALLLPVLASQIQYLYGQLPNIVPILVKN